MHSNTYRTSDSKRLSNPDALIVTNGVGTSLGAEGAGGKYLTVAPSFSCINTRGEVEYKHFLHVFISSNSCQKGFLHLDNIELDKQRQMPEL